MKIVKYRQSIGLLLGCITMLIVGTCSLVINGGISYSGVVYSAPAVVPAVLVMYCLGYLIGSMLETSKSVVKEKDIGYTNTLLQDIIKEEGLDKIDGDTNITSSDIDEIEKENIEEDKQ